MHCSYPPVRRKLETLMGTNIVNLTDRKFMLKLMLKLKENYVKQQRIRIKERKIQELSRTKNLVFNHLIPVHEAPEEIRQYPLFKLFTYCDELLEKKRKKKTKRKIRLSKSLYKLLYPDDTNRGKKIEEKEVYAKKIFEGNEEKLVPLTSEEIAQFLLEREAKQDIEDGFMLSEEDYDHLHYETQAVKYLRDAKTVDEMYSKAYDIIGILHLHVEKELQQEQTPEKNNQQSIST